MKKFALLTIITLVSLIAFSGQGICQIQSDTSIIRLPAAVAREVVKDLIRFDSAKKQLEYCESDKVILTRNLFLKDSVISYKDSVISIMRSRDANFVTMLKSKDEQTALYKELALANHKKYKKERTAKTLMGVLNASLLTLCIILAVR